VCDLEGLHVVVDAADADAFQRPEDAWERQLAVLVPVPRDGQGFELSSPLVQADVAVAERAFHGSKGLFDVHAQLLVAHEQREPVRPQQKCREPKSHQGPLRRGSVRKIAVKQRADGGADDDCAKRYPANLLEVLRGHGDDRVRGGGDIGGRHCVSNHIDVDEVRGARQSGEEVHRYIIA